MGANDLQGVYMHNLRGLYRLRLLVHGQSMENVMTKQERVWKLNEELGEEQAQVVQEIEDAGRAESWEAFFKQEVLGRKSHYKPE
jgi:hypothetical protein